MNLTNSEEPPKIQKEEVPTTSNGDEEGYFKELEDNNRHKTTMWTETWLRWTMVGLWMIGIIVCFYAGACLIYLMIKYTVYVGSDNEILEKFMGLA